MGDGWDAQLADAFRDCPETRALVTGDLVTLRPCELCPELPMWLLDDGDDVLTLWERTETFAGDTASSSHGASDGGLCPPYWAVPWVGGQGLARYILDNPDVVRGRSVLDVGSGCGVAALAAATAGASRVCGEFILIIVRAIGLTSCFVYRCRGTGTCSAGTTSVSSWSDRRSSARVRHTRWRRLRGVGGTREWWDRQKRPAPSTPGFVLNCSI